MYDFEIIIIGGGLAGLTAALHLGKKGRKVLVVEKNAYPRHRVCGEYVSNEVKPYLQQLGISIDEHTKIHIDTLQISTQKGKYIDHKLALGGFGISRFALDNLLYNNALRAGANFVFDTVESVSPKKEGYRLSTNSGQSYFAKVVLGAFGKRSTLDKKLDRSFIANKSPWMAMKCHYEYNEHPDHVVGLHSFPGGYGGLSKTENGYVNFCYLASYQSFQKAKSVEAFNEYVVGSNPILLKFLAKAKPVMQKPLTIGQIFFGRKSLQEQGILMLGDSAGMIHPLCGNGMAMAIHSGKLAAECLMAHLESSHFSMDRVISEYSKIWKRHFSSRLNMGRQLQSILLHPELADFSFGIVSRSKTVLNALITKTHGKPIVTS